MLTNLSVLGHSTCFPNWPRVISIRDANSMLLMDMLDGTPPTESESESSAPVHIMLSSWGICSSSQPKLSSIVTSLTVPTTISSMLDNSQPTNTFLTLLEKLQSPSTLNSEKWLFLEPNMLEKWKRESSLLWTTLCLKLGTSLFTPAAMLVKVVMSVFSSDSQELERLLWVLLETDIWSETTSMYGLIREFSTLRAVATRSV